MQLFAPLPLRSRDILYTCARSLCPAEIAAMGRAKEHREPPRYPSCPVCEPDFAGSVANSVSLAKFLGELQAGYSEGTANGLPRSRAPFAGRAG